MTILSDVLALAPLVCWELADPTAPAAADATGHGHTGVYGGTFELLQPGPQTATYSALFSQSGGCQSLANVIAAPPYSLHTWLAVRVSNSVNHGIIGNQVAGAGEALLWEAGGVNTTQLGWVQQNIRVGGSGRYIYDGLWHQLVWTRDAGANCALYLDGGLIYSASLSMAGPGATSVFQVAGAGGAANDQVFYYCAALFGSVLSPSAISSLYSSSSASLLIPANLNTITATDVTGITTGLSTLLTDQATILADLAAILAAVRKTY